MKKDKPQLFKNFNPTIEQITYMIVSNNKDILTPDMKRRTRSSKNTTPCDKYPSTLESLESILKKRDGKEKVKKDIKTNKVQQNLNEKLTDDNTEHGKLNLEQDEVDIIIPIADVVMIIQESINPEAELKTIRTPESNKKRKGKLEEVVEA